MHRLKKHERGVALLMVLSMLALVGTVVADFQYTSRVDLQLAMNARDELQAEYNALSALKLRGLVLKQSRKIQTVVGQLMGALGMGAGGQLPIGQILESIPVECGLMSTITKQKGVGSDDEDGNTGDFFPGECISTSASEHSKIAVSMLRNNVNNRAQQVQQLLLGLLSDRKLLPNFEEDDRNGTHAESPAELIAALADWVDSDRSDSLSAASDEDRRYEYLKDPYKAKNAPFDSLAEVQLVHGIDDDLYAILQDHITIYSDGTAIELSTAPIERILFWGLPACMVLGSGGLELLVAHPGFAILAKRLTEAKQLGAAGGSLLSVGLLQALVAEAGLTSLIDTSRISQVFSDKTGTTWYTVSAQGQVGNVTRRISAVFQASEGQFYYVRIE